MPIFQSRLAFDHVVPGTLADLRLAVGEPPAGVTVTLEETAQAVWLKTSAGYRSPHGGMRAYAELSATEQGPADAPFVRLDGHIRPGRLNLLVLVPFTLVAALFIGLGLLLMIRSLDAVGLVIVGAFLAGMVWVIRRAELSWMRTLAHELSSPDGWLLPAMQAHRMSGDDASS